MSLWYKGVLSTVLCLHFAVAFAQTPEPMSPAQQRVLNTFFSNFSEADVQSFAQGAFPPQAQLEFALRHATINKLKSLKKSADALQALVPADMVDTILVKYLGHPLPAHAQKTYAVPLADGEMYVFSQITTLTALGDAVYRAEGAIYAAGSGAVVDPHATPAKWQQDGEEVTRLGSFSARIKAQDERYVLLDYAVAIN